MSQENRTETMAVKLAAYARRSRVNPDPLIQAYQLATARRLAVLGNLFHPDLLHPARCALVLIEDAGCSDADVVTAAALVESEFRELRVEEHQIRADFSRSVVDLVRQVPIPAEAGEQLTEQLVTAPGEVALIAVAERLDHARHLHFRDQEVWRTFFDQVIDVYLPVARRINEPIAVRFARWSAAFERRFLSPR